jgi:hypothetical protein
MKNLIGFAAAVAMLAFAGSANAAIKTYKTEAGAQKHCPSDTVVYGAPANQVYHLKGSVNYDKMKDGKFVCKAEVEKAGWHAAKNGQ